MELTPIAEIFVLLFALVGTVFMLISGIGIIRLPDVFARMHAAGKAATLGVSGLLLAAGVYFYDEGRLPTMIALIILFFVTAPIATTTMARAAYRTAAENLGNDDEAVNPVLKMTHDDLADAIRPQP